MYVSASLADNSFCNRSINIAMATNFLVKFAYFANSTLIHRTVVLKIVIFGVKFSQDSMHQNY